MDWFLLADDEPEWMLEHSKREKKRTIVEKKKELEGRLARIRDEEDRQKKKFDETGRPNKKPVRV